MQNLQQTDEFLTALFSTFGEGFRSFGDGVQINDAAALFDEALLWQKGIEGFATSFPGEAAAASVEKIEELFAKYYTILTGYGLSEILASAIVSNAKGIFLVYVALQQGKTTE